MIERVATLMPPEAVLQAHDFTEQSLYYLEPGSLKHKVVISGERLHEYGNREGQARPCAFREMVASGILRKAVTIKGPDGLQKTKMIEQPGPITYVESTTATAIYDEEATRLLVLHTDESEKQTAAIVERIKNELKGDIASKKQQADIETKHHNMQRLLRPLQVRIPFIDRVSLPTNHIFSRRTFRQFVSILQTVALLRQCQKQVKTSQDGTRYIEADTDDYRAAFDLAQGPLLHAYSPLPEKSLELFEQIKRETVRPAGGTVGHATFTKKDCMHRADSSEATTRRHLAPLVEYGLLHCQQWSTPYVYKVVKPDVPTSVNIGLPLPGDLLQVAPVATASVLED